VWTKASGIQFLLPPDDDWSSTVDASGDGSTVIGASYDDVGERAFVWTAATGIQSLIAPGHTNSFPHAVSEDGATVSGTSYNSESASAFVWRRNTGTETIMLPEIAALVRKGFLLTDQPSSGPLVGVVSVEASCGVLK